MNRVHYLYRDQVVLDPRFCFSSSSPSSICNCKRLLSLQISHLHADTRYAATLSRKRVYTGLCCHSLQADCSSLVAMGDYHWLIRGTYLENAVVGAGNDNEISDNGQYCWMWNPFYPPCRRERHLAFEYPVYLTFEARWSQGKGERFSGI